MKYTIDELGIHYMIEDIEADRIAAMKAELVTVNDPVVIPLSEAVRACQEISTWIERLGDVDSAP